MRVDLRSDTVTTPSDAMRRAMADAEVGDDWYGDDPTVNRLQERAAEITGHQAALYVATGSMANQIALHQHVHPGHLVVCEQGSHVATVEGSSSAVVSGITFRGIDTGEPRRQLTTVAVTTALEPDPLGIEIVDLLSVENTHQSGGGSVMSPETLGGIVAAAHERGIPVHLDGARIFNAAVAAACAVGDFTAQADSAMFCLSKGLGAPIGSMLCGSSEFIDEARRTRILFNGAWRQAGIMAAAGLVALEVGPGRLAEDHERAARLGDAVADVLGEGFVRPVETNLVFADVIGAGMGLLETIERLEAEGVRTVPVDGNVRMACHVDVSDEDVERAIQAWKVIAA